MRMLITLIGINRRFLNKYILASLFKTLQRLYLCIEIQMFVVYTSNHMALNIALNICHPFQTLRKKLNPESESEIVQLIRFDSFRLYFPKWGN